MTCNCGAQMVLRTTIWDCTECGNTVKIGGPNDTSSGGSKKKGGWWR